MDRHRDGWTDRHEDRRADQQTDRVKTNLNNYFNFHLCLSFCRPSVRPCVRKITQIPVVVSQNVTNKSCLVCVMRQSSDPSGTPVAKAKQRYVYSILTPHGQSFRRQVRLLLSEEKQSYVYTIFKNYHLPRVVLKQLCASGHLGCTRPRKN